MTSPKVGLGRAHLVLFFVAAFTFCVLAWRRDRHALGRLVCVLCVVVYVASVPDGLFVWDGASDCPLWYCSSCGI